LQTNLIKFIPILYVTVFTVGNYTRQATSTYSHEFFHDDNTEGLEIRSRCAQTALEDMSQWIENGGEVGVSFEGLGSLPYPNKKKIRSPFL